METGAEARPRRVGHRERTGAAADEGRRRVRRQRQDHQARRQGRSDGEGRSVPAPDRPDAAAGRRRARRGGARVERARSSRRPQANLEQAKTQLRSLGADQEGEPARSSPTSSSSSSGPPSTSTRRSSRRPSTRSTRPLRRLNDAQELARARRRSTRRCRAASRASPSSRVKRRSRARSTRTPPRCSRSATCRCSRRA